MRIAKIQRHLGVDIMLKRALGEDLTIFEDFSVYSIGSEMSKFYLDAKSVLLMDKHYDVIIVDDLFTWEYLKTLFCGKLVWYCHGTYETAISYREGLKSNLAKASVIFPNEYKKQKVVEWLGEPENSIVLPISLPDEFYTETEPVKHKNGRIAMVGNHIINNASIYPGFDNFIEFLLMAEVKNLPLDIYGINFADHEKKGFKLNPKFIKHFVSPIRQLKNYSVSVFPSGCPSIGFCLAEMMVAGVAVITTPKEGLPQGKSKAKSFVITKNPEEMFDASKDLSRNNNLASRMGNRGKDYFWDAFNFKEYSKNLINWLENGGTK